MAYQILNNDINLNINKNIGKVLYIVEGERREINLLSIIFKDILKYKEIITRTRSGKMTCTYTNPQNENSKIVIINSKSSNVASIVEKDFIDEQIKNIKQYDLDFNYEDAAVFYIFDCDRLNDEEKIKDLLKKFVNSREPNEENKFDSIGGMLLLNYPSIETFVISNFESEMYKFTERFDFKTQGLKKYISDNKYDDCKLSEETIKNAFLEMVESLKRIDIDRINLDNTAEFNDKVFKFEIANKKEYMLSLLLISFIDLGIITINL